MKKKKIMYKKNYSVIILSAGNSLRMGFPKPFLKWDKNTNFLKKIVQEYKIFGCKEIIVILNKDGIKFYEQNKYTFLKDTYIIINKHLEYGRFYSVKLGLKEMSKPSPCFIQNVDNPFINKNILTQISNNYLKNAYTVPVFQNNGGHPVLISETIVKYISSIKENNLNLRNILNKFSRNNVSVNDEKILCNINTPEDYENLFNSSFREI